jgi:hypothetical protein
MEKTVNICVNLGLGDLAYSISNQMDYDECLDLIKDVEKRNQDWEFTEMILKYCLEQVLKEPNSDINEVLDSSTKRDIINLAKIIKDEN